MGRCTPWRVRPLCTRKKGWNGPDFTKKSNAQRTPDRCVYFRLPEIQKIREIRHPYKKTARHGRWIVKSRLYRGITPGEQDRPVACATCTYACTISKERPVVCPVQVVVIGPHSASYRIRGRVQGDAHHRARRGRSPAHRVHTGALSRCRSGR